MKKFAYLLLTAFLSINLTACHDDDNKGDGKSTATGFYTINGGNKSGKIPASLTAYDYESGVSTPALQDAFYNVNGIELGDGAQQAVICDGKMFIMMYSSNLIWVVEPETLKIIGSIRPEGDAQSPRYGAAANGKLYVSMYTGYVSEIDPSSMTITRSVAVGPNPDELGVAGNRLVVACSDGQNSKGLATDGVKYGNSCLSFVDLATFTETRLFDLKKVLNPTDVVSNGTDAFVVCKGTYDGKNPNIVVKVVGNDVRTVCEGTLAGIAGKELLVINAPYGSTEPFTYKRYNVDTLSETGSIATQVKGEDSWIEYPNGVFADPQSGDIVMLSYILDGSGNAQYRQPCYANLYDKNGNFKVRVECGVGAHDVTFITKNAK